MDYNAINIYSKEKFTLMSKKRGKQFRFIRYNGHNYNEIKEYLNEFSPNTKVWDEKRLVFGTLYGYSGRTAEFKYIPEYNVRQVIASNPFLVIDGDVLSLSMNAIEASDYLKQNENSYVFCFNDILATFVFDKERNTFLLFDPNHPKGIECHELPNDTDWYIGTQDNIHIIGMNLVPTYQYALHIVDTRIKFDDIVEKIENLKYSINKALNIRNQAVMFTPTWENFIRRKILSSPCFSYSDFQEFTSVLYKVVYEETKIGNQTRQALGSFADHEFTKIVGGLRHRYQHGEENFQTKNIFSLKDIYIKYLKIDNEPQTAQDYFEMQNGILSDFQHFLQEILHSIGNQATIIDIIQEDESDNVVCGRALLPKSFSQYKGLLCCIKKYVNNIDPYTRQNYPYYCYKPDYIEVDIEGEIAVDSANVCHCNQYILTPSLKYKEGTPIRITKIRPIYPSGYYKGKVVEYVSPSTNNPNVDISTVKKLIGKKFKVEVDEEGRTHIDNILIGKKRFCSAGDIVKISMITKNPTPNNSELINRYPFVASEIEIENRQDA